MESNLKHIFEKYPNKQREDTITILQNIQNDFGYLSEEHIIAVSRYLNISVNKIYGVATFYDNLRFAPKGKYHIRICNGTACHVGGASVLLKELIKHLEIEPGETDKDGFFSLEAVSCIGACGLAPVIEVNGEYHANVGLYDIKKILDIYREKEKSLYED